MTLTTQDRTDAFSVVRPWLDRQGWTRSRIAEFDAFLDRLGIPREEAPVNDGMRTSQAGIDLIHSFETCAKRRADGLYEAYPDPGSSNGLPWTIGWGSTGPDIGPGTVWTKDQCDARFKRDLARFEAEVSAAIGKTPTTQAQFDALVSFHYNTGAIKSATLTRRHNEQNYVAAAKQFGRWIFNDGRKLNGLVRRRAAERELYES